MKKLSKVILIVLVIATALCAFVACKKTDNRVSITFLSNDEEYANAGNIEQIKKVFENQPVREGYVFKGWFLDKGMWQQEVASENVEDVVKSGENVNVYAYWLEIVNRITVSFRDFNGGVLLEKDYERSDDQLDRDMKILIPSRRVDDDKYTYTFDKWSCDTSDLTQGYYLATPLYTSELRSFNVNYYVEGELVYTDVVKYGENVDLQLLADPQKPSTEKFDYTFIRWEGKTTDVKADTDLQAEFREEVKRFSVTFNYGNNKSLTRKIQYGASAVAPSSDEVAKSSTPQTDFIFIGWDNTFDNIRQNTVVNAKYAEQTRMYDVRFWVDGACVKYLNLSYGSKAEAPSQPVKVTDDGFTYEFIGWDVAYDNIVSNLDVRARFRQVSHTYTIEYVNWDGEPLYTEQVLSGEQSTYKGETPVRASNDKYDYIFNGWSDSDAIATVTRNVSVTAQFKSKLKTFFVQFNYGDGKSDKLTGIAYGTNLANSNLVPTEADVKKTPTSQAEYTFIGWDNAFDNITANTIVNAKYAEQTRAYDVRFFVDDECIKYVNVLYGSSVEAPAQPVKVRNDGYTYEFIDWDKDFDNIVENTDVHARFDKISNTFAVQYVNWDGSLLYTDYVETDGESVYVGETPTREPNDKNTYEFVGWTNSEMFGKVTQSFAAQAIFEENVRTYVVTFNYGHNLQKVIEGIPYGANLKSDENFSDEIPTDVKKDSTIDKDFEFIDWDRYLEVIYSDMEVNAIYKETTRRYIISFVNAGSVIKTQEVEYGKYPTAPSDIVFRNDTVQWNYTFLGWKVSDNDILEDESGFVGVNPNEDIVKGNITYTAIYLRKIQRYVVRFFNDEGDQEPIGEITVDYGTDIIESLLAPTASKTSTPRYHYKFDRWSRDLTFISADIDTYAKYQEIDRSYKVTFMNGDEIYAEYMVVYDKASPLPDENPTQNSTAQYDFEFIDWTGGYSHIIDDTIITANYSKHVRFYKVTFFNLATYELITRVEMGYGDEITTTIQRDGYDFDSWYRDPNCERVFNMEEDFVEGTLMLFGNMVMHGIVFNDKNEIIGYEGAYPNLVIPIAANGKRVTTIKKEAFKDNAVIGSVYVPNTITNVEDFAFSGLNLTESGGIYVQSEKKWTGTPKGWNYRWNWNGTLDDSSKNRPVTYGVDGIYTVGDFQYILLADDEIAIVDKFVNNTTAKAYIIDQLNHQKAFFVPGTETDEKTGIVFDVYEINWQVNIYNVTKISISAFEGSKNLASVFIPDTIKAVGNYAFSGVSANIFIQREKPLVGEVPSGWGLNWNSNRSGQEGERNLHWGVIGMDRVGDYSYIFMSDGTAIAVEYNGSSSASSVEVPSEVVFKDVNYRVTEVGDELFANMTSLRKVKLNEGIEKLNSKVFYMDAFLDDVTLPSTLKEIGDYAFLGAIVLKEIYIPASVKTIGQLVFVGMENLTIFCGVAKAPTYLPGISGYNPLWDVKLGLSDLGDMTNLKGIASTIVNPNRHMVIYNVAAVYTDTAKEAGRETKFKYALFNNNTAKLLSSSNLMLDVENYEMPSIITYNEVNYSVTAIGANAFSDIKSIKTLIVPSTVTSVDAGAFQGCGSLTIKTAHASKPSGWYSDFEADIKEVQWEYEISAATEESQAA